jgi:hypothetical protein
MPNKRFQLAQEDGALTQARRQNLKAYPMSPQEAAKVICEAHTRTAHNDRGFTVDWGPPPDFTKIEGGTCTGKRGRSSASGRAWKADRVPPARGWRDHPPCRIRPDVLIMGVFLW